jgi:hypothetical protein
MKCFSSNSCALCVMRIANSSFVMRDMYRRVRNTQYAIRNTSKAFTLAEVVFALAILALISSSVLVVINRCVASAADSALRMQAFEVARENMEKLLASDTVQEMVEYGDSNKYPGIKWQSVVETFYEPIAARMWVRAICSAEYVDATGQTQTVELAHWLTSVTNEQIDELMEQDETDQQWLAEQILGTIEEAAQYAEVDVETIQKWIDNGMLTIEEGFFVKHNLDLYKDADGEPSADEKNNQVSSIDQLLELAEEEFEPDGYDESDHQKQQDKVDPVTGLTSEQLDKMETSEVLDLSKNKKR